eukprot:gnl/Hemi2/17943_TR5917_c0_g1_i1.p1 gnl/Hemi2/17943_TR5917_c0_g1~~gnl/Hemi2/17943_TR5917_c0_g1_i1.p1  ORF type:complete len:680 (-),score=149.47 gnl/Hemi2/17943_TR5917_c0_g1_i1:20-2059(-)
MSSVPPRPVITSRSTGGPVSNRSPSGARTPTPRTPTATRPVTPATPSVRRSTQGSPQTSPPTLSKPPLPPSTPGSAPGSPPSPPSDDHPVEDDEVVSPHSPGTTPGIFSAQADMAAAFDHIRVCCRYRPESHLEMIKGSTSCVEFQPDGRSVTHTDDLSSQCHDFSFSTVFAPESTQEEVYQNVAAPIVTDILNGMNACILAYGQTGSGKTYTMEGCPETVASPAQPGIIPQLCEALFSSIRSRAMPGVNVVVRVSYVEIYMETVRDLLRPLDDDNRVVVDKRDENLMEMKMYNDEERGLWLANLTEIPVYDTRDLLSTLRVGQRERVVASTRLNEFSSRSHAIFIITVVIDDTHQHVKKSSQLYLVDLAGSEKLSKTEAAGIQLEEAKKINTSLLALGQVIHKLSSGKPGEHIPYRDSKLTRILQNAFGGNSRTALVICCSPSSYNAQETLATLRFGDRVKRIQNRPRINQRRTVAELTALLTKAECIIKDKDAFIDHLQQQLSAVQLSGGPRLGFVEQSPNETSREVVRQKNQLERKVFQLQAENNKFREHMVQVPPHFLCPITRELFIDPVVAQDGHTYERNAIVYWLQRSRISPVTNVELLSSALVPNSTLKSLIESNPYLKSQQKQQSDELRRLNQKYGSGIKQTVKRADPAGGFVYLFPSARGNDLNFIMQQQ